MESIGKPWSNSTDVFPTAPEFDTINVSKALFRKYLGGA